MERSENYILSTQTFACMPSYNEYGQLETLIMEEEGAYTVTKKPYDIIDQGTRYYGTTIHTTKNAMKDVFGKVNMAPVIIYAPLPIVFFPTVGWKDHLCAWLNAMFIVKSFPISKERCGVVFTNDNVMEIDMPINLFRNRFKVAVAFIGYAFIRYQQLQQKKKRAHKQVFYRLSDKRPGYEIVEDEQGE